MVLVSNVYYFVDMNFVFEFGVGWLGVFFVMVMVQGMMNGIKFVVKFQGQDIGFFVGINFDIQMNVENDNYVMLMGQVGFCFLLMLDGNYGVLFVKMICIGMVLVQIVLNVQMVMMGFNVKGSGDFLVVYFFEG